MLTSKQLEPRYLKGHAYVSKVRFPLCQRRRLWHLSLFHDTEALLQHRTIDLHRGFHQCLCRVLLHHLPTVHLSGDVTQKSPLLVMPSENSSVHQFLHVKTRVMTPMRATSPGNFEQQTSSRKHRTNPVAVPSEPEDSVPVRVSVFRDAAAMACNLLSSLTAPWVRTSYFLLRAVLQILNL